METSQPIIPVQSASNESRSPAPSVAPPVSDNQITPRIVIPKMYYIWLFFLSIFLALSLVVILLQYQGFFISKYLGYNIYRVPINPKSDYIKNFAVNYYMETEIVDIINNSEGGEIVTSIKDKALPPFKLTKLTNIYIKSGDEIQKTTIDNLAKKQRVGLILQFTMVDPPSISRILILP